MQIYQFFDKCPIICPKKRTSQGIMILSVIIVNYRVQYFLELCLHSVRKALQGLETEILVVDNHSADGSDCQRQGFLFQGLEVPFAQNAGRDRKSTRLNSSHQIISYAVFCLK